MRRVRRDAQGEAGRYSGVAGWQLQNIVIVGPRPYEPLIFASPNECSNDNDQDEA